MPIKKRIDDFFIKQVAAATLVDPTILGLSQKFNVSRRQIRNVMEDPRFKQELDRMGDEALKPAINIVRKDMIKLAKKAVKVVESNLDDDNLEAAKLVFKVLGVDQMEEKPNDTNLTVILPGSVKQETVIESEAVDYVNIQGQGAREEFQDAFGEEPEASEDGRGGESIP